MASRESSFDTLTASPPKYLQGVLESLPGALMVVDRHGVIKFASGRLDRLASHTFPDLVGQGIGAFVQPSDQATIDELVAATAARPEGEMMGPIRVSYLDNAEMPRVTQAWAVNRASHPSIGGIVVLLLPESSYERFDQVLESIGTGATNERIFGGLAQALRHPPVEGECFFLSPARDDRGVLRSPDLPGVPGPPSAGPWDEVWAGTHIVEHPNLSNLPAPLREAAADAGLRSVTCFGVHQRADGRYDACLVVWRAQQGTLSTFANAAVARACAIASLAMSHLSEEAGQRDAAHRDSLTGLGNRHSFFQALDAHVQAGDQPAILYVDLEGFKEVNDRLGQLAGDAVLRVAARRLASVMRPTDDLARLGGDEFAVLCNGRVTAEQAGRIAERIVGQLSKPLAVGDGETVDIGACVGIALDFPVGTPADTLLGRADHALFDAKNKGPGRWALASA